MKNYIIKVLNGMALGLFSSLIIGLILKQIGGLIGINQLIIFGDAAQKMMSPAIGAGVAFSLGSPGLVIFSAMVAGTIGGGALNIIYNQAVISVGEPVGAFIASLIASELGRRINGKSKVDIIIVPASVIIIGGFVGVYISPYISFIMKSIGDFVNFGVNQQPFIMGILVSSSMGLALTMPISSAAIGISLNLSGLAAGAAVVGGASHMIGFAVASYKDNGFGGFVSQAIGTSMIQISNIVKKPIILLPAIISSIILGPVSTVIFKLQATAAGSGMGTSGLVGQISTYDVMGSSYLGIIFLLHFILPGLISYIVYRFMFSKGYIKAGDYKLNSNT